MIENEALKKLDFLIGTWTTEGEVMAAGNMPAIKISGTDRYEWVLNGAFIQHMVHVKIGTELVENIEMIGSEYPGKYTMRSFDQLGNFAMMEGEFNNKGEYIITGDGIRSLSVLHESKNEMTVLWEQTRDGKNWLPWMKLILRK